MTNPMQEIALRDTLSPEVGTWLEKLRLSSTMVDDDGGVFGVQDSIAEQILKAASEDELFAAVDAGTMAAKDFLDTPFLLQEEFDVRVSTIRNDQGEISGTGFYLLIKVTDLSDMSERVLNTGAQTLMAFIWRLADLGLLADKQRYPNGYPLMLSGKPSANGTVVIPKKFTAYRPDNGKAKK